VRVPDSRRPEGFRVVKDHKGKAIAEEVIGPRRPDRVQPTGPADKIAAAVEQVRQGASYLEAAAGLQGVTPAKLAKAVLKDMRRRGEPVTRKARYPDGFKTEVVRLVREGGEESPDKLAARLGLAPATPWKWESQARAAEK